MERKSMIEIEKEMRKLAVEYALHMPEWMRHIKEVPGNKSEVEQRAKLILDIIGNNPPSRDLFLARQLALLCLGEIDTAVEEISQDLSDALESGYTEYMPKDVIQKVGDETAVLTSEALVGSSHYHYSTKP